MKTNRKYASQFVCLFICVAVYSFGPMLSVAMCQQADTPITKVDLIRSFKSGKVEKIAAESYIDLIKRIGVEFMLTPEIEKEIRLKGKYLGTKGLDDLVAAIRDNYRPEPIEPTEEEMKGALIRTMISKGGQLRDDGTVEVRNIFASIIIKIEKFEKLGGCKPVSQGAGFTCTYIITTSFTLSSNEGTLNGEKHAQALQWLITQFGGNYSNATVTRTFVRSKEGWVMLDQ